MFFRCTAIAGKALVALSSHTRSVFIFNLVPTAMEKYICRHLESSSISGPWIRKVFSKSTPTKSFKVDILATINDSLPTDIALEKKSVASFYGLA